jgi:2-iminobutanoate/2-iminopropanoate deaminase
MVEPMKRISTADAPRPVAAYSQGIQANGFVYTAGQVGLDPTTGTLAEGLDAQANLAFANVAAVLRAAGLSAADVVKVTIFMIDLKQFARVNAVFERFVGDHRPARSTVGVASLPLGALIEVEAIAALPSA